MRDFIKILIDRNNIVGVEIGVKQGLNAIDIIENLDILKLYLIDPWTPYTILGEQEKLLGYDNKETMDSWFEETKRRVGSNSKVIILKEKSENAVVNFEDNSLDFVYIDSIHTYDCVLQNCKLWYDKLKIGGLLCGHDYTNPECEEEIKQALNDFRVVPIHSGEEDWWIYKC